MVKMMGKSGNVVELKEGPYAAFVRRLHDDSPSKLPASADLKSE